MKDDLFKKNQPLAYSHQKLMSIESDDGLFETATLKIKIKSSNRTNVSWNLLYKKSSGEHCLEIPCKRDVRCGRFSEALFQEKFPNFTLATKIHIIEVPVGYRKNAQINKKLLRFMSSLRKNLEIRP